MELKYGFLDPYQETGIAQTTEVLFQSFSEQARQQLITNLPNLGIPHDEVALPERIILLATYHAVAVHRMITKVGTDRIKPAHIVIEPPKPKIQDLPPLS